MLALGATAAPAALAGGSMAPAESRRADLAQEQRTRIVVGFRRRLDQEQARRVLERDGAALLRDVIALRAAAATAPAADVDAVLARLRADSDVRYAERDGRIDLVRPRLGDRIRFARASRTPDDEGFGLQYSLRQSDDHDVDATNAWDHRTQCLKVAVVDTGVETGHKDLKDNIWINEREVHGNGRDDDHNGFVDDYKGVDVVDGNGSGLDRNGHGTHVAGIVAARGNNDRGVSGLCWKAKVMPVRVLDADGRGNTSDAAEGIVYAVNHGVHVVNASYGSTKSSSIERDAIRFAADHNTLIVAAAGNDHANADKKPMYPAAYSDDNVISVAASDDRDRLASLSNYGKKSVDLAAPGDGIASTWDDGGYRGASGTSMAAPLVSAAASMLRKEGVESRKKLRKLLLDNADDKDNLKGKVASGGRLNMRRALAAAD